MGLPPNDELALLIDIGQTPLGVAGHMLSFGLLILGLTVEHQSKS